MTDRVIGSPDSPVNHAALGRVLGHTGNYIASAGDSTEVILSDVDDSISTSPLEAFQLSNPTNPGSGTLDVEFLSGEAYVGTGVARDTSTTVPLPANSNDVRVYIGWSTTATNTVIIGEESAFNDNDPRYPIYMFETGADSVTQYEDLRPLGPENALISGVYNTSTADGRFVAQAGGSLSQALNFGFHEASNMLLDGRSSEPAETNDRYIYFRDDLQDRAPVLIIEYGGGRYQVPLEEFSLYLEDWEGGTVGNWQAQYNAHRIESNNPISDNYSYTITQQYTQAADLSIPVQQGKRYSVLWRCDDGYDIPHHWFSICNATDVGVDDDLLTTGYRVGINGGRYRVYSPGSDLLYQSNDIPSGELSAGDVYRTEIDLRSDGIHPRIIHHSTDTEMMNPGFLAHSGKRTGTVALHTSSNTALMTWDNIGEADLS